MDFWKKVVYAQYGDELSQKDQQIADKDQMIAQREQMIAQQDQMIAQREQMIAQREQMIAQRKQTIAEQDSALVKCARQMIRNGTKASEIAECTMFSLSRLTGLAHSMGVSLVL